jgi:hypothetical protein
MSTATYEGWAILELMGHRERPGYIKEVEIAGGKMLRIDIPVQKDDAGQDVMVTEFYGAAALYCMTPCSEEIARGRATPYNDPRPVKPMEYRERRQIAQSVRELPDEDGADVEDDILIAACEQKDAAP